MSITKQIIDNIVETRYEDIPRDVMERARDEVIDTIGCAIGGADDIGSPMIVDLVREWGGKGESTILAHGVKAPSHNVALANGVMARSFDFGIVDMCVEGEIRPAHIGETMVPTALAIAEQKGLSGRDVLTALVLGEDLASRIMAASPFTLKGFDTTGTVNTFGATATAGKLWGLDNHKWLYAFGIALNQMGGTIQGLADKTSCWKLNQGLSAQRGIFSVRLADKGFIGLKDPFFATNGYFALYNPEYNPKVLTQYLGEKYYTEVTFKPYPQCRGTHGATECALEVARKNNIEAGNIAEVMVIVHTNSVPAVLRDPFTISLVPHVDAIFSLEYTVANALLRGYPRPEHFTEESIRDPQITDMIKKIKMTTQDFPPEESFLCATVNVKTKDGKEYSEHVNAPKGNELEHPLTREEKREKFLINAAFTKKVSKANAEKALDMLEKFEEINDVSEVIKLLVA
ncbi:MmgE/PrpD family protein [Chloroflexota bacterium]